MGIINDIEKIRSDFLKDLQTLELDLMKRDTVDTSFGPADPKKGFELYEYRHSSGFAQFSVYLKDRMERENDEYTRNGDLVCLTLYHDGKVYTDEERNEAARKQEEEWEAEAAAEAENGEEAEDIEKDGE